MQHTLYASADRSPSFVSGHIFASNSSTEVSSRFVITTFNAQFASQTIRIRKEITKLPTSEERQPARKITGNANRVQPERKGMKAMTPTSSKHSLRSSRYSSSELLLEHFHRRLKAIERTELYDSEARTPVGGDHSFFQQRGEFKSIILLSKLTGETRNNPKFPSHASNTLFWCSEVSQIVDSETCCSALFHIADIRTLLTFKGRRTTMALGAFLFKSSRMKCSRSSVLIRLSLHNFIQVCDHHSSTRRHSNPNHRKSSSRVDFAYRSSPMRALPQFAQKLRQRFS